jgi:hypothetical protein
MARRRSTLVPGKHHRDAPGRHFIPEGFSVAPLAVGCHSGRTGDRGDRSGHEASVWYGIAAPKGTPPEAIEVLNNALAAALADPKMQARIAELGGTPMPMSPAEFGKLVADETEKWAAVVKSAGLSVE